MSVVLQLFVRSYVAVSKARQTLPKSCTWLNSVHFNLLCVLTYERVRERERETDRQTERERERERETERNRERENNISIMPRIEWTRVLLFAFNWLVLFPFISLVTGESPSAMRKSQHTFTVRQLYCIVCRIIHMWRLTLTPSQRQWQQMSV